MHEVNFSFDTQSSFSARGPSRKKLECSLSVGRSIRHLPKRYFNAEIHDAFGPDPDWVLRCFVDLGMSDGEIGRYVGLSEVCINILTRPLRGPDLGKYLE